VAAVGQQDQRVVIGIDPHERSVTIELMTGEETILGGSRYATDEAGFAAMRADVRQFPHRVWAIEGVRGIGRHIAQRLLAVGEEIVDVPPEAGEPTAALAALMGKAPANIRASWHAAPYSLAELTAEVQRIMTATALRGPAPYRRRSARWNGYDLGDGRSVAARCRGAAGRPRSPLPGHHRVRRARQPPLNGSTLIGMRVTHGEPHERELLYLFVPSPDQAADLTDSEYVCSGESGRADRRGGTQR
jgi:hypothetical protein